jgi:RNA polymerase sigma-70 factor (ECF subfamily)
LERLRTPTAAEAWERFVDLYTPMLFRWCRQLGLQEADAADVVQETITSLFHLLPEFRYRPGYSFRGWLFTVARNKSRDLQRRRKVRESVPISDDLSGDATDPAFGVAEREYLSHVLHKTFDWLRSEFPTPSWEIGWQLLVEDRPVLEVAERFGVSINTVYLTKSRILKRLRQELAGLFES